MVVVVVVVVAEIVVVEIAVVESAVTTFINNTKLFSPVTSFSFASTSITLYPRVRTVKADRDELLQTVTLRLTHVALPLESSWGT